MCEKCKAIDERITDYRFLRARINDPQTGEGIARLIEELEAKKKALHPEQD